MNRCATLALLAASMGCAEGSSVVDRPDFEPPQATWREVCGTEGPHRILGLAPGEHAYRIVRIEGEDRVLVSTFVVDPTIPLSEFPPTLELVTQAVGLCGEDPVEVARGLELPSRIDDRHWVGCADGGHGASLIDVTGQQPPRPLLDGWCPLRSTDHGVVTVSSAADERYGTLVIARDLDDPAAVPQVLAHDVRVPRNAFFGPGHSSTTSLWTSADEALALDNLGNVVHVDLATGQSTIQLEGVREFRVSSDGRYMVWQALDPAEGEPETPVSPVFLLDRETQTQDHLLNTHLEWSGGVFAGDYVVVRDDVEGLQLFVRETAQSISLPPGTEFRGLLDATQMWLVERGFETTQELRWSPGDSEPVAFATHQPGSVSRRGEGFELFVEDLPPQMAGPGEGRLEWMGFDGGDPIIVAHRAHRNRGHVADERLITTIGTDSTGHGPLWLIGPDPDDVVVLDALAFEQSPRLNSGDPLDGDIAFAVADPGGDRRGVYRGRVSP
ncbi:MAG: hypothetical protein K0V04_17950 [Deltaproteobacteria bacterium]|nr:hypothetical protein [Deltaproteobacteria bacterium]